MSEDVANLVAAVVGAAYCWETLCDESFANRGLDRGGVANLERTVRLLWPSVKDSTLAELRQAGIEAGNAAMALLRGRLGPDLGSKVELGPDGAAGMRRLVEAALNAVVERAPGGSSAVLSVSTPGSDGGLAVAAAGDSGEIRRMVVALRAVIDGAIPSGQAGVRPAGDSGVVH